MKIHELHSPNQRFLRSTQLERDFNDPRALESYILTSEIENSLRRLTRGLAPTSGQRAWRITGDYGSGKSSFALLLAALASREANQLPKHLRHLVRNHDLSGKKQKLLPVLVTGAREPLSIALLRALHAALLTNIDGRQTLRCRAKIAEELKSLEKVDESKIVQLVAATARELHERENFRGLLIILDEMGKFLEFAALHPERQDVYFLQQLGEASARSGDSCLFTIGLLHQGFGAYADKLSDAGQREWEKVAGRFEELVFSQPLGQVATLISAALELNPDAPTLRGWKTRAHEAMANAIELGLFGSAAPKTALVQRAPELYPLHPTVLPVLTRFFRRFGQNERSLFSFLLSSEPYALQNFAVREASPDTVYRLSDFYDFTAHNFGHRLSTQSFRSHWNHIDGVIRSYPTDQVDELRVLKTVGILNTIEAAELHPTAEVLALALDDIVNLTSVLKRLSTRGLLYLRGRSGGYALWPHTSVNLEQAFIQASEVITTAPSIAEAIRARLETRPIVASRHYIETGNLRHFEVIYTGISTLESDRSLLEPQFPADGRLIIVLCETNEQQQRAEGFVAAIKKHDALLIGVTDPLERLVGLVLELERWIWVEQQTVELKDDRYAAEEVSRQIAVSTQQLEKALARDVGLHGAIEVNSSTIRWFRNGEKCLNIKAKDALQSALSGICDAQFGKAPRVQNELVNRHDISTAAASARQKLFGLMLQHRHDSELGLPAGKAPPEKSMYLSVLRATGLHRDVGDCWDIRFPSPSADLKGNILPALQHILAMLERKADARVNVALIRDELRRSPFGVRDGLTPLLLLAVLLENEAEIAVYEDGRFAPEIEANLMMRLVKQPQTFEFQLTRITGVRRRLIEKFAEVLSASSAERIELVSIARPLCAAVAGLPEYVRLTERLSRSALALRTETLRSQEPGDLVFNSIPRALGFAVGDSILDASAVAQSLADALTELRRAFPDLQARMAADVLLAFGVDGKDLYQWRVEVSSRAETVILGITDPEFRAFVMKLTLDAISEGDWLETLGSLIVRRPPSRWRDQDEIAFKQQVFDLAQRYLRIEATCFGSNASSAAEAVRIALTRTSGEEVDRVITLSSRQSEEAQQTRRQLVDKLPADKNVALAALSQLMWTLMEDKS
jgi:hypothetical protein